MDPLSGVLGEAWKLYRAYAAHLLAIAFVIYIVAAVVAAILTALLGAEIVPGLILGALPVLVRSGISSVVAGTLAAPFLALVVTLIYYRLSEAHGGGFGPQAGGPGGGGYGYPAA